MNFFLRRIKTKSIGQKGEDLAEKYLRNKGYDILERNWKNKFGRQLGEIDIVAKNEEGLVFVEVKTRESRSDTVILPEDNIDRRKLARLMKVANIYISYKKLWDKSFRFDAITVMLDSANKAAKIRHLENIYF